MKSTTDIATRLVALCRRGEFAAAQQELYSPDAVSVESEGYPGPREVRGRAALAAKGKEFNDTFQVHACQLSEPLVSGDYFAVTMTVDVTEKKSSARFPLNELCVYTVHDGKITREEFFYQVQG
jgi:ketosteroid isomerase-like protein